VLCLNKRGVRRPKRNPLFQNKQRRYTTPIPPLGFPCTLSTTPHPSPTKRSDNSDSIPTVRTAFSRAIGVAHRVELSLLLLLRHWTSFFKVLLLDDEAKGRLFEEKGGFWNGVGSGLDRRFLSTMLETMIGKGKVESLPRKPINYVFEISATSLHCHFLVLGTVDLAFKPTLASTPYSGGSLLVAMLA
jgi:hypothetical protein